MHNHNYQSKITAAEYEQNMIDEHIEVVKVTL